MMRSIGGVALLVVSLVLAGCGTVASGQDEPTPVPGCPEGEFCLLEHVWPEFTMVYKTRGDPVTFLPEGAVYRPLQTRRLEYRDKYDWTLTVIASESLPDGENATGSWWRQDGTTYTKYSAVTGYTHSRELKPRTSVAPDGPFTEVFFAGFDLATRQDGLEVESQVDVCSGDTCHQIPTGVARAGSQATGQTFPNEPYLDDLTYTNDEWAIPIEGRGFTVLSLEIQPTNPDPAACQTNLREVIVSASLEGQQWDTECASTNRTDTYAHYYTFEVGEEQMVAIEAESPAVDLYLYLLEGASKDGRVIAENDDLSGTGSSGQTRSADGSSHASGIERSLSAGTYTVEVTTNETGKQSGAFSLDVRAPLPMPTPIPTPMPTLTPTPTPGPTLTPTATPTPTPTPEPLDGNPRAASVTGTSVRVSWDRLHTVDREIVRDVRVNYRRSASDPWTFGNYVETSTWSDRRPQATVPRTGALTCNTEYEFQVEYKLDSGWHDYGDFTASTTAC